MAFDQSPSSDSKTDSPGVAQLDYLIVGQGLAGTLVAYFLQQEGCRIHVVDNFHVGASTKVAAGLINPITGRRYVKSWRIDQLLPFALSTYRDLEKQFQMVFIHQRNIIRSLFSIKEENDWLARCQDPDYQPYILEKADLSDYDSVLKKEHAYGEVQGGVQVDIGKLIHSYRGYLKKQNCLIEAPFDFDKLQTGKPIFYKGIPAKGIIFCEGNQMKTNPFFNYLPMHGDKGEALVVRIKDARFSKSLKQRIFISPIGSDLYWIGSNYIKSYENDRPTKAGGSFLTDHLKEILNCPFEVVDHLAAIRPTIKDRRPIIGRHPHYPSLYLFNGLGTKGTSLGPFFARQFCDFLLQDTPLDEQVNLTRFPLATAT